jgi:hypothetical protein
MIAEDVLERGLAAAADAFEPPAGAVDRLRERITPAGMDSAEDEPRRRLPRPHGLQWLPVVAAGLIALIAIPIALGGGGTPESGGGTPQAVGTPGPALGSGGYGLITQNQTRAESKSGAPDSVAGGVAGAPAAPAPQQAPDTAGHGPAFDVNGQSGGPTNANGESVAPLDTQQRIVRTGSLDLQVAKGDVDAAVQRLTTLATSERGYVSSSQASQDGNDASATVTMRVPVGNFDDAVNRARSLGTKVIDLTTSSDDVTSRYVDLSARIRSATETRNAFRTLLLKANTIGQTLTVQARVDAVQTEIERLIAQRKLLASQSALSTLTVNVDQPGVLQTTPVHHQKRSGLSKAVHTSVSRFVHGVEAIIAIIGPVLLVALLAGLAWLVGRLGYRRFRRTMV